MKKIEAIIRPFKFDEVREKLDALGIGGLTATEVRGYGNQKGRTEVFEGSEYVVDLVPKIKLEIVIDDSMLDDVVNVILNTAYTGRFGDGKIFVTDIEDVIKIRTKERGITAL